jgi:hypothetical protein
VEILPIIVWRLLRYIQQGRILKKRKHERERERERKMKKGTMQINLLIIYIMCGTNQIRWLSRPARPLRRKTKVK